MRILVTAASRHGATMEMASAIGHATGERLVVSAVRAPDGDFRDWEAFTAWARGIAGQLKKVPAAIAA